MMCFKNPLLLASLYTLKALFPVPKAFILVKSSLVTSSAIFDFKMLSVASNTLCDFLE